MLVDISKGYIVSFNNCFGFKTYELAKHAHCIMIRELKFLWKQPIVYYFTTVVLMLHYKIKYLLSSTVYKYFSLKYNCIYHSHIFYAFVKNVNLSKERPFCSYEL